MPSLSFSSLSSNTQPPGSPQSGQLGFGDGSGPAGVQRTSGGELSSPTRSCMLKNASSFSHFCSVTPPHSAWSWVWTQPKEVHSGAF